MAKRKRKKSQIDGNPYGEEPIFTVSDTPDAVNPTKPVDSTWSAAANWYNYSYSTKHYVSYVLDYAKDELKFDKDQIKALKSLPDWVLVEAISKLIRIFYRGWKYTPTELLDISNEYQKKLVRATQYAVKENNEDNVTVAPVISIQERQKQKVQTTICDDYDMLWDEFDTGNFNAKLSAYSLCKSYGLKGSAINIFKEIVEYDLKPIADAYNKVCEEAVEAYSHLARPDLTKLYNTLTNILEDLDNVKLSAKSQRMVRAKKPKAADKQVNKLKYKDEDIDYKVTSINPVMIPTKDILWIFNTKTRMLTMFKTDSVNGFTVSGSTLKGFNPALSKCSRLRKPEEVLPTLLKATPKKVEKLWDTLTTKIREPKGRINKDTIILRVN